MTSLHKSIEAAREALKSIEDGRRYDPIYGKVKIGGGTMRVIARNALATLPAKPMTEDEIIEVIIAEIIRVNGNPFISGSENTMMNLTIRALRDGGCLYVQEKETPNA